MNKRYQIIQRLTVLASFVCSLVLVVSANSNSCIFLNEPEAPESLQNFKFKK